MGASGYTLDSLDVRLGSYDGSNAIFELRAPGGSNPANGTPLLTFTNPATQGDGFFTYNFTPSTSFTLQNGTTYFIFAYAATGTQFSWSRSEAAINPTSPSGVATYVAARLTSNGGGAWGSSNPSSFQLNGTAPGSGPAAVPEPSTAVMAGLSIATIFAKAVRRRRKSSKSCQDRLDDVFV
jgi:hypothetical protein